VESDGHRRQAGSPVIFALGGCVSLVVFLLSFRVFPSMVQGCVCKTFIFYV
jgi:hypothetical protein